MADEDWDETPEYYDDGDNYFWVEDTYALADDLAEQVVPDPPFDSIEYDWDDLTRFEYFYDIEYDSDGWHDRKRKTKHVSSEQKAVAGTKRKAGQVRTPRSKRIKRDVDQSPLTQLPPVMFVSKKKPEPEIVVDPSTLETYSILPDWRQRFRDIESFSKQTEAPREASVEDGSEKMEDATGDDNAELEALKMALEKNLSSLGLDSKQIDQSLLLRLATSMMSQSDEAEEIMAQLIEGIHGQQEEEDAERDAFAEWAGNAAKSAVNGKHEDGADQEGIPEDLGHNGDLKIPPTTPRSTAVNSKRGTKRRADSPNDVKPAKRKAPAEKVGT